MTSAATQPARGTGGHREEGHGYGLVLFASVLLVSLGCFNLIYGIAAIANAHVFAAHAHYGFGSLNSWGWITLIIGVLQLPTAGVVAGGQLARWFGVAMLGLNAIGQMFFHPGLPILVVDDHRGGRGRAVGGCAHTAAAPTWKPPSTRSIRGGCGRRQGCRKRRTGLLGPCWRTGTSRAGGQMQDGPRACVRKYGYA